MQVTGVVEDSLTARAKAVEYKNKKIEDTFAGLRLMEVGRAVLVGGVWGVLGLRRRILVRHAALALRSLLTRPRYIGHMQG